MEAAMAAMFPKGIRALMVDDDNRFVRSSTSLLSVLKFEVVSCSTVAHALKSLSTLKLHSIDVVLVHAAKAASCGFNFRAIIETDLNIPVIYFLPLDHRATGYEAAKLLSTLEAGTYIMMKPLDVDEVRSRLWRVIAWRKCALQGKAAGAGDGFLEGEEDEGRVHYKVVMRGRRGQKRKGGSNANAAGSSSGGADGDTGGRHPDPVGKGKGKEKVNEGDDYQQQPVPQKKRRGRKPKKTSSEASKPFQFKQPSKAMPPVVRQPPPPSLFVESVLRTLKMPPYNANFSDGPGPSNIAAAAFAAAAPPPPRPLLSPPPPPPPLPPAARNLVFGNIALPVAAAAATVPAAAGEPRGIGIGKQQQEPAAAQNVVFGNMAPPPAATAMDTAASQLLQDARPMLMFGSFGPFPYQGSQPHVDVPPQDMVSPAPAPATVGGVFAGGGSIAGASASVEAGTYRNAKAGSFLQAQNLASATDMGMLTGWADPAELVVFNGSEEAAMLEELFDDINNHGAAGSPAPLVATDDQVLAMASNVIVNDPAMAAGEGAFDIGSSDATAASSFMAPHQDLIGAAPNGGNKDTVLFMAPRQDLVAAANNGDQLELESDMYGDDDTLFPLDALLEGVPSPLFAAGAGGGSLIGEEEEDGGDMNDLAGLNGLDIPHDVFQLDDFLFPHQHKNKKNKNNNVRE